MELWLSAAELPQELTRGIDIHSKELINLKESVPTHSIIASKTSSTRPLGLARKAVTNTHTHLQTTLMLVQAPIFQFLPAKDRATL